jgi:hypothetical protein
MKMKLTIGAAAIAVVGLAALGYGVYLVLTTIDLVLLWAIAATALLPVAAAVGWAVGRYEVAALLRGIDLGAGKVVGIAERIADVKDRREPPRSNAQAIDVRLLPPTIYRELPSGASGDGDVINL